MYIHTHEKKCAENNFIKLKKCRGTHNIKIGAWN